MNKKLLQIYALIMIECRLNIENACQIFHIDPEVLETGIKDERTVGLNLAKACQYLLYETRCCDLDNKKGIWKANVYYRRLLKILNMPDKEEKRTALNSFIESLNDFDYQEVLASGHIYSAQNKRKILSYRLKYGKSNKEMRSVFNIGHTAIQNWESELSDDDELKIRLQILRHYLNATYERTWQEFAKEENLNSAFGSNHPRM